MVATLEQATKLGLREEEFEKIKEILGRTPNFNEVAMNSVMWSEHCSYKNSIKWLKTLPRDGDKLLVKAGEENAGLVDIGDGLGCVFKIESHNHPSAIEPFQGAATGVGGIHRDIFTMGARPIASLNSLRFGNLDESKTQHLLAGITPGIGAWGIGGLLIDSPMKPATGCGKQVLADKRRRALAMMSTGQLVLGFGHSALRTFPGNHPCLPSIHEIRDRHNELSSGDESYHSGGSVMGCCSASSDKPLTLLLFPFKARQFTDAVSPT